MFWIACRIACSLACAPNCTVCESSTRTVAEERAEPGPELPVYQATALAEPLANVVAEESGDPDTRNGGLTAVTVPEKPKAAKAAVFELDTESVEALSVCRVMTPPLIVEGVEVPVIASIFESSALTLSLVLIWLLPLAVPDTNVIV